MWQTWLSPDSWAQMFQQGLSATTRGVEGGQLAMTVAAACAPGCVHGTRYGRPPTTREHSTATRSPLSAAERGELGASVNHTLGKRRLPMLCCSRGSRHSSQDKRFGQWLRLELGMGKARGRAGRMNMGLGRWSKPSSPCWHPKPQPFPEGQP